MTPHEGQESWSERRKWEKRRGRSERREVDLEEKMVHEKKNEEEFQMNMMQRLNPTNPLRVLVNNSTRVATPPSQFSQRSILSLVLHQPQK